MISRSQSFGAACIKSMAAVATSLVPVLFFAGVSDLAVALLLIFWTFSFKSSFLPHSSPQQHQGLIYSALHPLFMVIGFILISGEVHRWLPGWRSMKKSVHLCLQGVALASGIFGISTKFQGKKSIVADFYSLHYWMGLICILLFGAQWLRNVSKHCAESMLVNSLGLGLALVSGVVILAAVSPKYQALQTKLIYSSDNTKCMPS